MSSFLTVTFVDILSLYHSR